MKSENVFTITVGAAVATTLIVLIACVSQYNDGLTTLRKQAVDRGCSVTPTGQDYIIDCKH